jgi:hypothetical protein
MRFLFVGERRSPTARRMKVTWEDGRLAAKPLFEAIEACGFQPESQAFINLYPERSACHRPRRLAVKAIREQIQLGAVVVGMGRKVQTDLGALGIPHRALVHPAARGKIRKRERYIQHVREVLNGQAQKTHEVHLHAR